MTHSDGEPIKVYSIATGKVATPTEEGVRVVSHVESFPYLTAPRTTKRRKNPRSYGPKIIVLDKGKIQQIGTHIQLVHSQGLYKEMYDKQAYYYLKKQKERQ